MRSKLCGITYLHCGSLDSLSKEFFHVNYMAETFITFSIVKIFQNSKKPKVKKSRIQSFFADSLNRWSPILVKLDVAWTTALDRRVLFVLIK